MNYAEFIELQPSCPVEFQSLAYEIFISILGPLGSVGWHKDGSLAVFGSGKQRIGFGARRSGFSIHFRMLEAIDYYQSLGGRCPCGRVTIKVPYHSEYDADVILHVVKAVSDCSP
jgi:hypothetical protein